MNNRLTILAVAMAGALASTAVQAEPVRSSGVGVHIAHQGNQALRVLQREVDVSVQQAADKGLDQNLERIQVAQSREAAVGGGGPVAPKEVSVARHSLHSTCP